MVVVVLLLEEEEDCLGQSITVIVSFDWLLVVVLGVVEEVVVAWETTASLGILDILLLGSPIIIV